MSKVFICDICGKVIKDKYTANMTQFGIDWISLEEGVNKRKIHLCENCYRELVNIAKRKK